MVRLYMDVHIPLAITSQLRLRGVDVLTAQDDDAAEFEDHDLLDRAAALGRVLVTQDTDFLLEGTRRQNELDPFSGIIYFPQLELTIGHAVADLELFAKASETQEWMSRIVRLPI